MTKAVAHFIKASALLFDASPLWNPDDDVRKWQAAADAAKEAVAVYPVAGWWKNRPKMDQSDNGVNYSLVVSIEAPEADVDLWTPVYQQVAAAIEV